MDKFTAQLESTGPEGYSNASTQVDLPLTGAVAGWAECFLSPDMLDEKAGGIERRPHVTVLYGLTDPDVSKVARVGRSHGGPIGLTLDGFDFFEAPDNDVLFVKVKSDCLHSLHRKLRKLPNVFRFPDYSPHMTIAYLKKGSAKVFKGQSSPFDGDYQLPGFWLNLAKNHGEIFTPTTGVAFERVPFNEDLCDTFDALTESTGRRRPTRQMRLLYVPRKNQDVPKPKTDVEAAIDDLIRDVHQVFDWSAIYSGDKGQARIAAYDLFNDVMKLAKLKIDDEAEKEKGLRFTLSDVMARWSTLVRYARLSSEVAMRAIRRRVRV